MPLPIPHDDGGRTTEWPLRWSLSVCLIVAATAGIGRRAMSDWPQWRGEERQGTAKDFEPPAQWPTTLEKAWTVEVGEGHNSPVIIGSTLLTLTGNGTQETVRAIDRSNGLALWEKSYVIDAALDSAVGSFGSSPRSTPLADQDSLFTFGVTSVLSCWEIRTGKLRWQRDFKETFPIPYPEFGTAASPILIGKQIVVPIGSKDQGAIVAVDPLSGKTKWLAENEGPAYASIALAKGPKDKPMLIVQTQSHLTAITTNGKPLWKLPFETEYRQNAIDVLIAGDRLVYGGYGKPLVGTTFNASGLTDQWEDASLPLYMSNPVADGNRIFGMSTTDAGIIFCTDLQSGKLLWRSEGRCGENVTLQLVDRYLVLLNEQGQLTILPRDSQSYAPIAQYDLGIEGTYAMPVLDEKQIFIKSRTELTAFSVP
jgi:outer membrane protein assembly factor BamB